MIEPRTFTHSSLLRAWSAAAQCAAEGTSYLLVTSAGVEWNLAETDIRKLDSAATLNGFERPSSVAEMLLPRIVATSSAAVEGALEDGLKKLGRARRAGLRFSGWTHTYFERITGAWYDRLGHRTEIKHNRLLGVIRKLNAWGRNAEAALYIHTDLASDSFRTRGGPCLQYVQFRAFGDHRLQVVGLYRAHDYGNKALGNLIGLARLGSFVASKTNRQFDGVTVVSLHPFCERKSDLRKYVDLVEQV